MFDRRLFVFSLASTWLIGSAAHAYRPFDGTDADTAELGEFELELGPLQLLHRDTHNDLLTPATVLNLGILPRTELVVDFVGDLPLRAAMGDRRYALTDTDVLVKIVLRKGALQDESGPSVAIELGPLIPEINGQSGFGASAALIISERWDWFVAHVNNLALLSRDDLSLAWMTSLITEYRWNEQIWPVSELLWERDARTGSSKYSALAGMIWSVRNGFDLDAAVIVASDDKRFELQGRLGFTWAFAVWEGQPQSIEGTQALRPNSQMR